MHVVPRNPEDVFPRQWLVDRVYSLENVNSYDNCYAEQSTRSITELYSISQSNYIMIMDKIRLASES